MSAKHRRQDEETAEEEEEEEEQEEEEEEEEEQEQEEEEEEEEELGTALEAEVLMVGAGALGLRPRRARLAPGSYADADVERDIDDDYEEDGTEEEAGSGDGSVSGDEDDRHSSPVAGVSWARREHKWGAKKKAGGKTIWLGYHDTEEAAEQAVRNYVKDGTDRVKHFKSSSKFKGVSWDKNSGKWRAKVKSVYGGHKTVSLGYHATEEAAKQACTAEHERRALLGHVIPPAGSAVVQYRKADCSSHFTGVSWHKVGRCKLKGLEIRVESA